MDDIHAALEAWRDAEATARLAEEALEQALRIELRGGRSVDPGVLHEVARLRAIADEKLAASIDAMTGPSLPREVPLQ